MSDLTQRIAALSPEQREELLKRLAERNRPKAAGSAIPTVEPDPTGAHLPFAQTYVQQTYLTGRSGYFDMGACGTNFFAEYEVTGGGRPFLERFQRALDRLVARHDSLRTVLLPDGRQQILAFPVYTMPVADLRETAPAEAEARLAAERERMKFAKADVYAWPLFEFAAYWLADGRIRILSRIEALILDGTSNGVLLKELLQLLEDPAADLPPLNCSFRDYVRGLEALRETELYARSKRYWLDRVKELPAAPEFPLASLPTPLVRSEPTPLADYLLTPDEWNRLKAGATRAGLTPSAVVLTALTEVVAAWSASPAFTIGLVASYRLPFHPDIAQLVGNFNQVTLLGVDGRGGTFQERARRLQLQLSTDLEHMYFPGTSVLQEWNRLRGAGPSVASPVLANSLIEYSHSAYSARQLDRDGTVTPDGRIALVDGYFTIPQITFEPIFGVEPDGSLAAQWVSLDSLYPPGMFAAMFAAFKGLLKRLAAEPQAWEESGFTFAAPPASAAVTPARAVQAPPRAGAVRRYLAGHGLGAGETVALLVEPGADALGALAGIWAAGCTALPLNPDWPETDLRVALEQSGAALLLDLAEVGDAPAESAPTLNLEAADCLLWRPGKGLERFSGRSLWATAAGLAERYAVGPGARVGVAAPPATDLWLAGALLALVAGGDLVEAEPTVLLARPALLPAERPNLVFVREERGRFTAAAGAVRLSGGAPGVLWSLADGRPLPGFRVEVRDPAGHPRPDWVPGALHVDGRSAGARARRLPDGRVETVWPEGRCCGYRVPLHLVEEALVAHPSVRAAIATEAAAYVLSNERPELPAERLRSHLAARLPGYMLPPAIIPVAAWPLTPDGEVDLARLPAPPDTEPAPLDDLEAQVAVVWAQVLGCGPVGARENLFLLGCTSLQALRLIAAIEQRFGRRLPLTILADDPTVRGFARALR